MCISCTSKTSSCTLRNEIEIGPSKFIIDTEMEEIQRRNMQIDLIDLLIILHKYYYNLMGVATKLLGIYNKAYECIYPNK